MEIKINKDRFVEGKFTVKQRLVEDEKGNGNVVVHGIFSTHDYIEELNTLESERYLLLGVKVFEETFGTNDYEITYEFTAESLTIKDDYVPDKVKAVVEADLYQDEAKEYFHSANWEIAEQIYDDIVNGEEGLENDR